MILEFGNYGFIGHEGDKLTDFINTLSNGDKRLVRLAVNLLDGSTVLDFYPTSDIEVFPQELLDLIQNYVDGEYIYIPRKECNRKFLGETTRSIRGTSIRNADIYKKYKEGVSTKVLSEMYYLSLKSIQKIIFEMKKGNE